MNLDSASGSSTSSEGSQPMTAKQTGLAMENCLVGQHEIELPEAITEDSSLFMSVCSPNTWTNVLTEAQKRHLLKFLPTFPEKDGAEKQETLKRLFGGQNFKFGNPLKKFHRKLRGGQFSPDIARYNVLCKKAQHREYRYQQKVYYTKLLKEILINKQRIFEAARCVGPEEPIKFEHFSMSQVEPPKQNMTVSVKRKCARILEEVNKECGVEEDTSSSESEDESTAASIRSRKQLIKVLRPGSPDEVGSGVTATFDPIPSAMSFNGTGETPNPPVTKRALSPVEMTEADLAELLKKHKRRRSIEPYHPELNCDGLSLEDIICRVQTTKKFARVPLKKRAKERPTKKASPGKVKVKTEPMDIKQEEDIEVDVSSSFTLPQDDSAMEQMPAGTEDEAEETKQWDNSKNELIKAPAESFTHPTHFFTLLREIMYEDPEHRVTTLRVEERVREWQELPTSSSNSWFYDQTSWVDQVASTLKFLSGDVLGLSLENFVPYLDYKERAQHWKWIGISRDSDAELEPLYRHWLLNKDDLTPDTHTDGGSATPPPRIRTSYTVHPTTEEEKSMFRDQELIRFNSPHLAFTYRMHKYESVVGPVKGVYNKDGTMNKAREHALLINDRPAYVTILTLVRDAASRLPNGEGTRSDICELLKDSQFLAPAVTDAQINTVVSGALDRLHYEKDPCVKYDVNRKLWIYLHRNRTQEEVEKIHQAQVAAVKAKKALQKPKPTKKSKDAAAHSVGMPTCSPAITTNTLSRQSSLLSTASNDSFVNVETLSPHPPGQSPKPPITINPKSSSPHTPTASPRITPQSSPKVINPGVMSPKLQPPNQAPTASKLVAANINQSQIAQQGIQNSRTITVSLMQSPASKMSSPGLSGVKTVSQTASAAVAGKTSQTMGTAMGSPVVITSTNKAGTQSFAVTTSQVQAVPAQGVLSSPRPVTLSLLQPHAGGVGAKLVESLGMLPGQGGKPRTLLLQTHGGKTQKVLQHPQIIRAATPGQAGIAGQQILGSQAIQLQLPAGSSTQTVAAALAKAGVMTAGGNKPILTRMVGGKPQVVNLSSLWGQAAASPVTMTTGATQETKQTVKIQGGLVQTVPSGVVSAAGGEVGVGGATTAQGGATPHPMAVPNKQQQIIVSQSGKPAAVMITKPSIAGARASTATTQTVAQIIQSGALGNKSAMIGKPIIIGGKSTVIGGKPLHIGGKPVQFIGKAGQLGIVQTHPHLMSGVNIVTQASTTVSTANTKTATQASASMVSQLLQQRAQAKASQLISLPQGEGQVKVSSQIQGQALRLAHGQHQHHQQVAVAVSGSGQTKVVTLGQGLAGVQQLSALKTGGLSHNKSMVVPAGGMVQAGQLLVRPTGQHMAAGAKVLTPQLLSGAGGLRPTLLTAGGAKGMHNFQLLKTVISQPGGKPGHTTILLAQPSSHAVTMATAQTTATLKVSQASTSKSKAPPIYARIITPPPGVRLAAVRPGQVISAGQVTPVHGVNMLQTMAHLQDPTAVTQIVTAPVAPQSGSTTTPTTTGAS